AYACWAFVSRGKAFIGVSESRTGDMADKGWFERRT
ncbi:MAG: hypothetical protein ACI8Z0_001743, partial [Lentimonas sp.]